MNRRGFLTRLLPAAALGSTALSHIRPPTSLSTQQDFPTLNQPRACRQYAYYWTGLKEGHDNFFRVGQWVAWARRQKDNQRLSLYVTVPGFIGGSCSPGEFFDLTARGGRWIGPETSETQITEWLVEGEGYLHQLMDAYSTLSYEELRRRPSYYYFPL
jgi:hypothetical protein